MSDLRNALHFLRFLVGNMNHDFGLNRAVMKWCISLSTSLGSHILCKLVN